MAKGIARVIAKYYGEAVNIVDETRMHAGDPFCSIQITVVPSGSQQLSETSAYHPPEAWYTPTPGPPISHAQRPMMPSSSSFVMPAPAVSGQIVQYRILKEIGRGGMGIVYVAEDVVLGRQVALKLMTAELAVHREHGERFLREARAMAALQNDHIVTVYQVGQHGEMPFIAMQLLRGITLEDRLAQGTPLSRRLNSSAWRRERQRPGSRSRSGSDSPRHQTGKRLA